MRCFILAALAALLFTAACAARRPADARGAAVAGGVVLASSGEAVTVSVKQNKVNGNDKNKNKNKSKSAPAKKKTTKPVTKNKQPKASTSTTKKKATPKSTPLSPKKKKKSPTSRAKPRTGTASCGATCSASNPCQPGLSCRPDGNNKSVCIRSVKNGQSCGGCVRCAFLHRCAARVCVPLTKKRTPKSECKPVPVGARCGGWCSWCTAGSKCEHRKGGARCIAGWCEQCNNTSDCPAAHVCNKYSSGLGRCASPNTPAVACSECSVCPAGKECHNAVCVDRHSARCSACTSDAHCRAPLRCKVASNGTGKCSSPAAVGKSCAGACTTCAPGLVCRDGHTCSRPRRKRGQSCTVSTDCVSGYLCKQVGASRRVCAVGTLLGADCSHPLTACYPPLTCDGRRCRQARSTLCGACSTTAQCTQGLVCKMRPGGKGGVCAQASSAGQLCTEKCWGCAEGLSCNGRICTKERRGLCAPCTHNADCQRGLHCTAGAAGKRKKCSKMVGSGASCRDSCWVCGKGTSCRNDQVCRPRKSDWCADCLRDDDCTGGLVCKKTKAGLGRCAVATKTGDCSHACVKC